MFSLTEEQNERLNRAVKDWRLAGRKERLELTELTTVRAINAVQLY